MKEHGMTTNKEIIKALGGSKNFDISANNDYVAEMLEGQLDNFIKNKKVKLSDDDFEKWVEEIQVLCAECYKHGWERALEDAEKSGLFIKPPCKVGDKIFYVNKYAYPVRIEEFIVSKIALSLKESTEVFELHFVSNGRCEFLFYSRATDDVFFNRPEAEKKLVELKGDR